jgi:hypothetical protein
MWISQQIQINVINCTYIVEENDMKKGHSQLRAGSPPYLLHPNRDGPCTEHSSYPQHAHRRRTATLRTRYAWLRIAVQGRPAHLSRRVGEGRRRLTRGRCWSWEPDAARSTAASNSFFSFSLGRGRKNSATVSGSGFAIAGTHWAAPVEQPGELGGLVFIGLAHLF